MATGTISPHAIRLSARPGEAAHQDFVITPGNGTLVAAIAGDGATIALRELVAFDLVRERLTDEEFSQLPPDLQDEEHRFSVTFVETGRVGAGSPLPVRTGQTVSGVVDCVAPADADSGFHSATLTIDGLRPGRVDVPIVFVIGAAQVEFINNPVIVHQGQFSTATVKVTLPGAPETTVTMSSPDGFIEAPPRSLLVPAGQSATTTLDLRAAPQAPLGPLSATLTVKGNSDSIERVPFEVLVKPPVRPPELDKAAVVDHIHQRYLSTGGRVGRLGYPISDVQFAGNTAIRQFSGGQVRARAQADPLAPETLALTTQAFVTRSATITLVGFKCVRESDHDQISDNDEPYFAITVRSSDGSVGLVQPFGPFDNTRTGSEVGIGAFLASGIAPNPVSILVQAYENDFGDPEQTARNLQALAVEVAQKVSAAAASSGADAADGPGLGLSSAAGGAGSILAGPIGGLAATGLVASLGLGDDFIGQSVVLAFTRVDQLVTPRVIGQFMNHDFNAQMRIDGGGEGIYDLFFDIQVTQNTPQPVDAEP